MIARRPRTGVTLVELLVVIALTVLLAGLVVGVSMSGAFGSQRVVSGADRVSEWLVSARQTAMRNNRPHGVRFRLHPTDDPTYYLSTEAHSIDTPDMWLPNPGRKDDPGSAFIAFVYWHASNNTLPNDGTHRQAHFVGTADQIAEAISTLQPGDSLIVPGPGFNQTLPIVAKPTAASVLVAGQSRQSALIPVADKTYPEFGANTSGALGSSPTACRTVFEFGFQQAPRLTQGEPALQMPSGTAIDCRMDPAGPVLSELTTTYGINPGFTIDPSTGGRLYHLDVVFSPNGRVITATQGLVCLWVRDPSKSPHPRRDANGIDSESAYRAAGEQSLVTIYNQFGKVAAYPPAPGSDPYLYAKQGTGGF